MFFSASLARIVSCCRCMWLLLISITIVLGCWRGCCHGCVPPEKSGAGGTQHPLVALSERETSFSGSLNSPFQHAQTSRSWSLSPVMKAVNFSTQFVNPFLLSDEVRTRWWHIVKCKKFEKSQYFHRRAWIDSGVPVERVRGLEVWVDVWFLLAEEELTSLSFHQSLQSSSGSQTTLEMVNVQHRRRAVLQQAFRWTVTCLAQCKGKMPIIQSWSCVDPQSRRATVPSQASRRKRISLLDWIYGRVQRRDLGMDGWHPWWYYTNWNTHEPNGGPGKNCVHAFQLEWHWNLDWEVQHQGNRLCEQKACLIANCKSHCDRFEL